MEGATGIRGNHLDPGAQEYYPAGQIALAYPQIYYPYPPPPPPAPAAAVVPAYHHHQLSQPQQYAIPPPAAGDGSATRAVVLSMVPPHVGEGAVRAEMEAFGGVRAVEMGAVAGEGTVTVHFYDLRSAQAAVAVVREQHVRQQSRLLGVPAAAGNWDPWDPEAGGGTGLLLMHPYQQPPPQMGGPGLVAGHAVWAQFAARELEGPNQGSLVVFNCDAAVSSAALGEIFQAFGDVRAVREAPSKPHKFVEFFDVRDAARALSELDGKEILGRRLVVEFSRLGGSQARSSSSSFYKRTPSQQKNSSLLPPRLLRTTSDPSRWSQVRGDAPHPPSPTSRGLPGAAAPSLLKRSDAGADTTARIGNARGGGGAGRRSKSGINPSASTSSSSPSSSSSKLQQSSSGNSTSRKGWKSHPKNSGDARFLFKEGAAEESSSSSPSTCSARDSRTTVMIKNIPNKYSQKLLLNMLDNHCIHCNEQIGDEGGDDEPFSAYDFVYLPIDFNNKCNVGYGFVNLTTPEATLRLYKAFHMQPWEVFNSRKICQVTYARLQGLEALKEHFKNSKFACDNDDYLPVVFSPPRDGRLLTDPDPIGGRVCSSKRAAANLSRLQAGGGDPGAQPADDGAASTTTTTTTSTHAPSDQADGGDNEEHDDDEVTSEGAGGSDGTGSGLSADLRRLSYNQD